MSNIDNIKRYLEENLDEKRIAHTYGVVEAAVKLAETYNVDKGKAYLGALLHDSGKNVDREQMVTIANEYGFELDDIYIAQPELLHGVAGAYIAKNIFSVDDVEILDAIVYHTIPRINMTKLDKIISVADLIEPTRHYSQVDKLRQMAYDGLDEVFAQALRCVIVHVVECGHLLHINSVIVYNNLLNELK